MSTRPQHLFQTPGASSSSNSSSVTYHDPNHYWNVERPLTRGYTLEGPKPGTHSYNLAPVDDLEVSELSDEPATIAPNSSNANTPPPSSTGVSSSAASAVPMDSSADTVKPPSPVLKPSSLTAEQLELVDKVRKIQLANSSTSVSSNAEQSTIDPKALIALVQKLAQENEALQKKTQEDNLKLQKIAEERDLARQNEAVIRREQSEANARHKQIMDEVAAQAMMVRDRLTEQERQRKDYEAARERQYRDQESTRKELEQVKTQRNDMMTVFKDLRENLVCPICTEVAILPKVLGTCGHIACQNCLKQLDDVAFSTLTTTAGGASARQHLLARRCPLCRVEIVGQAFPVLPLKDIASKLIGHGYIEVAEQAAVQKHIDAHAIQYEKESAETKHIIALQLGCYAQSQLAQHSVNGVLAKVTNEQWLAGVYVLFEAAVSRVFFETFATTLHGKAGGLNVLVNASQRMLAVQLIDKSKKPESQDDSNKKKTGHILIKVSTDGRFVITTTPAQPTQGSQTQSTPAIAGGGVAAAASSTAVTTAPTAATTTVPTTATTAPITASAAAVTPQYTAAVASTVAAVGRTATATAPAANTPNVPAAASSSASSATKVTSPASPAKK